MIQNRLESRMISLSAVALASIIGFVSLAGRPAIAMQEPSKDQDARQNGP